MCSDSGAVQLLLLMVTTGTDDGDDLEMYGSETATTSAQHTLYSFEVLSHDITRYHMMSCDVTECDDV